MLGNTKEGNRKILIRHQLRLRQAAVSYSFRLPQLPSKRRMGTGPNRNRNGPRFGSRLVDSVERPANLPSPALLPRQLDNEAFKVQKWWSVDLELMSCLKPFKPQRSN
ncbi:hypothetical protein V2G26_008388 [Clonostachys chloroleuca]